MAIRPIVRYPHPALLTKAQPVESFDAALHQLIDDMVETMYAAKGVGLAANQINVLQRVTVMDCSERDGEPDLIEVVNPEIIDRRGEITWEEGCLSLPDLFEKVKRARHVTVRFQDRFGAFQEREASELLAVCFQHEIDHLDGICFVDRMGPIKKQMALKEFKAIMADRRSKGLEPGI